ncbi:MAG TPA: ATP phosphoribosyltransferase regulatory subunit [Kofleriaceae bacterium]|nr:ATP phosphoribosyltransferase regulatory subunit [Kofleriaceae bacterium]
MLTAPTARIRLPAGVRDFLPAAAARRRALTERLLGEFERYGFERIITPLFECADVLERGLGADARAAAIRFVEPVTGEVVALRPDITPQVARLVATRMAGARGPIRLCYEGAVARMATGARGQREILQAGVELYGAGSPDGDAEVIAVAASALAAAGVPEARLEVGHVALVRHALDSVAEEGQRAALALALRKKDRGGVARAASGLARPLRGLIEALPTLFGEPADVLARARALRLPGPVKRAVDGVEAVLDATGEAAGRALGPGGITLDLGEVRGFDYYSGVRLAGYVAGAGDAVLRGGRYDHLAARYGHPARAIGFAADIEGMAEAQSKAGLPLPPRADGVLVAAVKDRRREAGRVAAALRAAGHRAAVDLSGTRNRRALAAYAAESGFSHVLELGRDAAHWIREGGATAPVSAAALRRAMGDGASLALPAAPREARRD